MKPPYTPPYAANAVPCILLTMKKTSAIKAATGTVIFVSAHNTLPSDFRSVVNRRPFTITSGSPRVCATPAILQFRASKEWPLVCSSPTTFIPYHQQDRIQLEGEYV